MSLLFIFLFSGEQEISFARLLFFHHFDGWWYGTRRRGGKKIYTISSTRAVKEKTRLNWWRGETKLKLGDEKISFESISSSSRATSIGSAVCRAEEGLLRSQCKNNNYKKSWWESRRDVVEEFSCVCFSFHFNIGSSGLPSDVGCLPQHSPPKKKSVLQSAGWNNWKKFNVARWRSFSFSWNSKPSLCCLSLSGAHITNKRAKCN